MSDGTAPDGRLPSPSSHGGQQAHPTLASLPDVQRPLSPHRAVHWAQRASCGGGRAGRCASSEAFPPSCPATYLWAAAACIALGAAVHHEGFTCLQPLADYLPVFLHEIPRLLRHSDAGVDVALIQVQRSTGIAVGLLPIASCMETHGNSGLRSPALACLGSVRTGWLMSRAQQTNTSLRHPSSNPHCSAGQPPRCTRFCVAGRLRGRGAGGLPVGAHGEQHVACCRLALGWVWGVSGYCKGCQTAK